MKLNDYNVKAINDVYKNAHIALQSISDILSSVDDEELKRELKEQYEGYERIIGKISSYMYQYLLNWLQQSQQIMRRTRL